MGQLDPSALEIVSAAGARYMPSPNPGETMVTTVAVKVEVLVENVVE